MRQRDLNTVWLFNDSKELLLSSSWDNIVLMIFLNNFCLVGFFFGGGLHSQHMEVPRLGVQSELQLPAYDRASAMWDPSRVYDLHSNAGSLTH